MAIVEGKGLASLTLTGRGRGHLVIGGRGLAQLTLEGLGEPNLDICGKGLASLVVTGLGKLDRETRIASVVAVSATKVRITFDQPMTRNAALTTVGYYSITPVTAGAVPVYVSEVQAQNITQPTFVEVTCSEMTDGATYKATVATPTGPIDIYDNPLEAGYNEANYTGKGEAPTLSQVISIGANRVDVVFSEPMKDNADIRNPSKYSFDNGLNVLNVLEVEEETVKLVTSDQYPGLLYTLTITP